MYRISFGAFCLLGSLAVAPGAHAADEPLQLKFGFPAPPTSFVMTEVSQPWSKDVEAASNNAVQFTFFPGGAVGNFNNILDRTLNAVVDVSFGIFGPYADQFPRTHVTGLPFEANNTTESAIALWRLYANGTITPEYGQVHVLTLFNFPTAGLHTKKRISKLEDVKGMKFSVTSRSAGQVTELLGAVPITMTPSDVYQSAQRGLIDGINQSWTAVQTFKLYEVENFHLEAALGQNPAFFFMNKASYAKLPAAAKTAIDRHSGEVFARRTGKAVDANDASGSGMAKGMAGHLVYSLDAAETARWKKAVEPMAKEWIAATPDGAKILAAYRAELEKIRAGM